MFNASAYPEVIVDYLWQLGILKEKRNYDACFDVLLRIVIINWMIYHINDSSFGRKNADNTKCRLNVFNMWSLCISNTSLIPKDR